MQQKRRYKILSMRARGLPLTEIAEVLGLKKRALHYAIKRYIATTYRFELRYKVAGVIGAYCRKVERASFVLRRKIVTKMRSMKHKRTPQKILSITWRMYGDVIINTPGVIRDIFKDAGYPMDKNCLTIALLPQYKYIDTTYSKFVTEFINGKRKKMPTDKEIEAVFKIWHDNRIHYNKKYTYHPKRRQKP